MTSERLSLSAYVRALAILAVLGLVALFVCVWFPQRRVQVNGPLYLTIVNNKELLADAHPPPLYPVDAYNDVIKLADATDVSRKKEILDHLDKAQREFADSAKRWQSTPLDDDIRTALGASIAAGDEFFAATEGMKAAVRHEDAAMKEVAVSAAEAAFVKQREANQRLVALLDARVKDHEQAAQLRLRKVLVNAVLLLGLVTVLLGAVSVLVTRKVARSIRRLREASANLKAAVDRGELSRRLDEQSIHPDFREVAEVMNGTMDAFAQPFAKTMEYVTSISRGELPSQIPHLAQGDFNAIYMALNGCIASVQALVDDASLLARAGVEGNLSVRADATRHQGDFRRVIEGVNHTLDAVVGPLTVASQCVDHIAQGAVPPEITEEFRGDFDVLKKNLNTCIRTVDAMVADTKMLSAAAVAGRLQVRADAAKHRGDFRDIVQGVNDTLDAIVVPFRSTAEYFERISHGDIPPMRSDESHGAVQGELVTIRASINRCVDALG